MDEKKKIITIIGLVIEVIGLIFLVAVLFLLLHISKIPELIEDDIDHTALILQLLIQFIFGIVFLWGIVVFFNLYLFVRLIKGKFNEQQAKKVYLYQAIWGGISFLFNQVTGILYLISGIGGYNNQKEETNIRDGI